MSGSLIQQNMQGKYQSFLTCIFVERCQWRMNLMKPKGKGLEGLLLEKNAKPEVQIEISGNTGTSDKRRMMFLR